MLSTASSSALSGFQRSGIVPRSPLLPRGDLTDAARRVPEALEHVLHHFPGTKGDAEGVRGVEDVLRDVRARLEDVRPDLEARDIAHKEATIARGETNDDAAFPSNARGSLSLLFNFTSGHRISRAQVVSPGARSS